MKLTLPACLLLFTCTANAQLPVVTELPDEDITVIHQVKPFKAQVDFFFNHGRFPNTYVPSDPRPDRVINFGWNVNPGGGQVVPNESAVYWQMENHYRPGADGREWNEVHLNFLTRGGANQRPISVMADENTGESTMVLQSGNMNFIDSYGTVNFQLYGGKLIFQNGVTIRSVDNNVSVLGQYNAAGNAVVPLIKVDNTDTVVLGNGSYPVKVGTLILKDGGASVTVTIGDANSCGTGFRCLRVPNP